MTFSSFATQEVVPLTYFCPAYDKNFVCNEMGLCRMGTDKMMGWGWGCGVLMVLLVMSLYVLIDDNFCIAIVLECKSLFMSMG